jgi:RNA-directed DNA polymerase
MERWSVSSMAERKTSSPTETEERSGAWREIPWRRLEKYVYRVQKRIYRASQRGNTRQVEKLQKLLLKSKAARLLAVRRVTQDNQGKKTAGVDGVKSVPPKERFLMVKELHAKRWNTRKKPSPVRRVWIPKPGKAEKRPLGIPTMLERAKQALVKMAIEPAWEAVFESDSYGFRPGRSCHDAIEAIFNGIRFKPKFVFDADIKGCFDNIDHEALLKKLDTFPKLNRVIRGWLKAGVMEGLDFTPTDQGTPQGGVISPLLANVALHGMEKIAKEGYKENRSVEKPILVRYADDFVILYSDKAELQKAAERVTAWLADMGLQLSQKKTRITHTLDTCEGSVGFDFLGFTVRQYRVGKTHTGKDTHKRSLGFKTLIRPSKEAIKRHTQEIGRKLKELKNAPQAAVISELNPIIRGWCNYHRWVRCRKAFKVCQLNAFKQLARWEHTRHPRKTKKWAREKYRIQLGARTVFGKWDKDEKGNPIPRYVRWHDDTDHQDYVKVRGEASPYDGNLIYWARRLKQHPLVKNEKAKLLHRQQWQCPQCGLYFTDGDVLEIDHDIPTVLGGKDDLRNKFVYHRHCHDEKTARDMALIAKRKAAGVNHK